MSKKTFSNSNSFHNYQGGSGGSVTIRCHDSHPVLKIGGGEIVGANCRMPRSGYNIYVGLDREMAPNKLSYPWTPDDKRVTLIHYPIADMGVPDEESFINLVDYLCNQLQLGRRIHVGCFGGHGRTGLVLAGIMGNLETKDAIGWVRENHCKKAVESQEQIDFLVKLYNVDTAKPIKSHAAPPTTTGFGSTSYPSSGGKTWGAAVDREYVYAPSKKTIWN